MNSHRRSRFLLGVVLVSVLAACAPKPEQQIIGRWQLVEQEGNMTIAFRSDGTYEAKTEFGVMTGKWMVVDSSHLATWADETRPKRENEFRFENEHLIVIDGGGAVHKHRRIE